MDRINRIAKSLSLALLLLAVTPGSALSQTNLPAPPAATSSSSHDQSNADRIKQRWILSTLIVVLLGIGAAYRVRKPQNAVGK